ncbi:MAG: methylated-DNA--[protein]-cysteine S-methyltransferase [Candidatus Thiodiazotropha sp. (ex Monitilora ramsayi)]|nr:methylated-DNA--[protein]-cysteine S-methyltransferase [Candidatus Thiodiazotropha sp. (ex Monitilora ramsayi)]
MSRERAHFQAVINLPFGNVGISLQQGKLSGVAYLDDDAASYVEEVPGISRILQAIEDYLSDAKCRFDLDLLLRGTPYQKRVWRALQSIPAGETLTYGELAARIGSGARAVGNACRTNPCPLVIPCHRVVAANGLGGFAGERSGRKLEIKRWLLRHEGRL